MLTMKVLLRISKPQKRTVTVTLPVVEGCQPCLQDLYLLTTQILGVQTENIETASEIIRFSLNNKDFLSGDSVPLSDLGIVNGDLLYVHLPEVKDSQMAAPVSTGNNLASGEQMTEMQQDEHDMAQHNSQMEPSASPSCQKLNSGDGSPSAKRMYSDQSGCSKKNQCTNHFAASSMATSEANEDLKRVIFIKESDGDNIPQTLMIVLEAARPLTEHQVLFLVTHVLVLETGFLLQNPECDLLPKQEAVSQFKLTYKCRGEIQKGFSLIAVPMSNRLLIHAVSDDADKMRYSLTLKPAEYVMLSEYELKFKNLSRMSREFKENVSYPMLQHLASDQMNLGQCEGSQCISDLALISVEELNRTEVNKYLNQAILIRESAGDDIPQGLRLVLVTARPGTTHQALFLVIHVLVLETGFVLQNCEGGLLPKQEAVTQLKLTYRYRGEIQKGFNLVAVPMANRLLVHAVSHDADSVRYNLKLTPAEYVISFKSDLKFKRLAQLSREVKDKLSYPMLQHLTSDTNTYVPSLTGLLYEIQILILKYLDAPSLLRLSETCYLFSELSKSPVLWQRMFVKDFGKFTAAKKEPNSDWFALYKEQYLLKKRLHDHLRNACIVAPYFGHDSSIYPPFARRPGWVPPFMVGGDYDRLPGGPFLPGSGGNPFPEPRRYLVSHQQQTGSGRLTGKPPGPLGLGRFFRL